MTKQAAMKRAVKLWGKRAIIRDNGLKGARTPEQRATAQARYKELRDTLSPDEKKARREELTMLMLDGMRYRYDVGENILGLAFGVRGSGDTWEQAFESVK